MSVMTASEVLDAVATHYSSQGAALVREVGDSVGFTTRRHIDALALGCWASRGLFVHAIEVKRNTRDLKRELAVPDKAESIARFCDRMWVAAPAGVIDPEVLPEAWGLYEVTARGLLTRKLAKQLEAEPLNRKFVMAVARACAQQLTPERKIAKRVADAQTAAFAEAEKLFKDRLERAEASQKRSRDELESLQGAIGGSPWRHLTPADIGKAAEAIRSLSGTEGALNRLSAAARTILEQAECIERVWAADHGGETPK